MTDKDDREENQDKKMQKKGKLEKTVRRFRMTELCFPLTEKTALTLIFVYISLEVKMLVYLSMQSQIQIVLQ